MNLSRVLDVSLPELPKWAGRERYFRFNPNMVWKERTEKGITQIYSIGEKSRKVFAMTPEKWKLVQLFNGVRNYQQIAKLWNQQCGVSASPESVQEFAEKLDGAGFWLRTPEEEAMAMMEDLKEREKRVKTKSVTDFTKMYIFVHDADELLNKVYPYIRFIWKPAFVISSVVGLVLMVSLWFLRRDEVWRDSIQYWSMAGKTWRDILEFYLIFAVVGFFHESGHALTAKNFGAEVHKTGLMLVYTIPAFFVETTEATVHGTYFQRMYVVLAGFWFELMLCAVATFFWWGTAIGGAVHNLAYKFILVGGIMPVIFNMNPLMRLDGYLFFSKMVREPFLKERSTAYLSGWVQNRIFRLPAKVEPLPRRRAIFFATYAFLSGVYTYSVLTFLARLTYKFAQNISPEWAFVPAVLVGLKIFRTRIETFVKFLKTLYSKHEVAMRKHQFRTGFAAAALLIFVFLPLWKEVVRAPVILEPKERASLTAQVPGRVEAVNVNEGDLVPANATIAVLAASDAEGEKAQAMSELQKASAAAVKAELSYTGYGIAQADRRAWQARMQVAADKQERSLVRTPIAGVVVRPRIQDLRGTYVTEGTPIAEIQDVSRLRARVFVDETDMRSLQQVSAVSIRPADRLSAVRGEIERISISSEQPDAGLIDMTRYKGLKPPPQYVVSVLLNNDGSLRGGMTGEAKLFGRRRSAAKIVWQPIADFISRKIW